MVPIHQMGGRGHPPRATRRKERSRPSSRRLYLCWPSRVHSQTENPRLHRRTAEAGQACLWFYQLTLPARHHPLAVDVARHYIPAATPRPLVPTAHVSLAAAKTACARAVAATRASCAKTRCGVCSCLLAQIASTQTVHSARRRLSARRPSCAHAPASGCLQQCASASLPPPTSPGSHLLIRLPRTPSFSTAWWACGLSWRW